jgi:hypothetical protein
MSTMLVSSQRQSFETICGRILSLRMQLFCMYSNLPPLTRNTRMTCLESLKKLRWKIGAPLLRRVAGKPNTRGGAFSPRFQTHDPSHQPYTRHNRGLSPSKLSATRPGPTCLFHPPPLCMAITHSRPLPSRSCDALILSHIERRAPVRCNQPASSHALSLPFEP